MPDASVTLTATLRTAGLEARRGIVRLHPEVFAALGLRTGDTVLITGERETAGVAARAEPGSGATLLYADDLLLGNAGCRDGDRVTVRQAPRTPATRVDLTGMPELRGAVTPDMLRTALLGKVVSAGDNVSLLPQDVLPGAPTGPQVDKARASLRNTVGYLWTSTLLTVVACDPPRAGLVTMGTVVGWHDGPVTHSTETRVPPRPAAEPSETPVAPDTGTAPGEGRAAPAPGAPGGSPAGGAGAGPGAPAEAPPNVDDLPGLRSQARQLTELLDLGFHHGEVLGKLGTSISLGVLITGPNGSGKSALVRAVAAEVDAGIHVVWAPEVAALSANDAAARLREVAAGARAALPAVLLVSDVEALASGDGGGTNPVDTVFRQVVLDALRSGTAVVCTSSRPEAVDRQLRQPGLLDHEITVPLPDLAGRREQLAVLTRVVPLASDVHLDDVAARTPGFVAADLAALVREAGVRAALRHRSADPESAGAPAVGLADFDSALEVVHPTSMGASLVDVGKVSLDEVGDMAEVKEVLTESVLWPLTYPDAFARLGVQPPRGVLLYGPPGCGKTYLVRAIAGTGKANVLSVKGAELLSKWVGDSERAVRELFRHARDAAPTLIFLDEIDALAPMRGRSTDGGTTDRVVASLLTELDGVESLRNVVVVGATNRPDLVDAALLRPGRLERLIFVPPPDAPARAGILRAAAKSVPLDPAVDLDALAAELDGYSAADCAALIRQAALAAMRESIEAATVTAAHVATARARVHPSLDPGQVAALAAYATMRSGG
ncbi:MAG TPA: AAA family ATPase [Micromonosporaceae bacterium]|nr:AAA family ATPase [Micromonosporaceae bacterium]